MKKCGDKKRSKLDQKLADFASNKKLYRVEFPNTSEKIREDLTKTARELGLCAKSVERGTPKMIYEQSQAAGLELPKPGELKMPKMAQRGQIVDLIVSRLIPSHRNNTSGRIRTAVWCASKYAPELMPDGAVWLLPAIGCWLAPGVDPYTRAACALIILQWPLLEYMPERFMPEAWRARAGQAADFVCFHAAAVAAGVQERLRPGLFPTAMAITAASIAILLVLLLAFWLTAPALLFKITMFGGWCRYIGMWCQYSRMPGPWKREVTGAHLVVGLVVGIAFVVWQALPCSVPTIWKIGTLYAAWSKLQQWLSHKIVVAFQHNWKKSIDEWLYYIELAFEKESSGASAPFADVEKMARDRDFAAYDDCIDMLCVNIDWMADCETYAIRYKHMQALSMEHDLPELAEAIWEAEWLLPPSGLTTVSEQDTAKGQLLLHLEQRGGGVGSSLHVGLLQPIVGAITKPSRHAKLVFASSGKHAITDVPMSFSVMIPPSGTEGCTPDKKRKCRVLVVDRADIQGLRSHYLQRAGEGLKNCWDGQPDHGGGGPRGDRSGAEGDLKFDVWCAVLQMARFADDTELSNSVVFSCNTTHIASL
jgi:hypothetical protein